MAEAALADPAVCLSPERLRALGRLARGARAGRMAAAGLPGGTLSRQKGRGLETIDIRAYVPGDDPRFLDRNVTARTGRPHVRDHHDERAEDRILVADFRPAMLWGTRRCLRSVAAAEALALAGWRAVAAGGRVGLIAFAAGERIVVPPRGQERGMEAAIGGLVAAHARALAAPDRGEAALDRLLDEAEGLIPRAAIVLIATSLETPGQGLAETVRRIGRRARLRLALIEDAFERQPAPGRYPMTVRGGPSFWARVGGIARRDARAALIGALGLRVARIAAEAGPEAMLPVLEALDGRRG